MANDITLFLAGDAMIAEPWSAVQDPAFDALVAEMRAADATLVNLETVIHAFRGHAQADSGGTYTAAPPAIARELKWAGIDMLAHANNHAFDYGSIGILETLENAEAAELVLAGAGPDLQAARAPRYFACDGGRVGLVSMASTFVGYGRASRSRPDLHGRPGLNPLELVREDVIEVSPRMAGVLRGLAHLRGKSPEGLSGPGLRMFGRSFRAAARTARVSRRRPVAADAAANLAAISEAARQADLTIASIHAHSQKQWLQGFARDAFAAGADVVFCHGPHDVRGIELAGGKPIFYGLGDFAFQIDSITRLPAEAYERFGLGDEATADDVFQSGGVHSLLQSRQAYEGCAAALRFCGRTLAEIRLLPLDLQFDARKPDRGRPRWAEPALGRSILERIAERSKPHGTKIRYDALRNQGVVEIS